MGWLPIALALAGFIFFVFIINYNSIKTQEDALREIFHHICQTAKARHTLLIILDRHHSKEKIFAVPGKDFYLTGYAEYLGMVQKELQSIENSRTFLRLNQTASPDLRKKLKSLQLLNHRQQISIKIFSRKTREYNNLISTYPTSMVARVTGHFPLN